MGKSKGKQADRLVAGTEEYGVYLCPLKMNWMPKVNGRCLGYFTGPVRAFEALLKSVEWEEGESIKEMIEENERARDRVVAAFSCGQTLKVN